MVSVAFVNGYTRDILIHDPLFKVEKEMDDIVSEVNEIYLEYLNAVDNLEYDLFFEEASEEDKKSIKDKEKNFVEKLGSGIIAIFDKAIAFITNIIEAVKNASFKRKSDIDKVEALAKKHPELKDDILKALRSGELQLNDVKSIAELEKSYEEIMKMNDPNSMKSKWAAAKKKFEDNKEVFATIGVIGTSAVAIATILPKIKGEIARSEKSVYEAKEAARANRDKIVKYYGEQKEAGEITNNSSVHATRLQISREFGGSCTATASAHERFIFTIQNKIASILSKYETPESKSKFHGEMSKRYDELKKKEDESIEKKFEEAKKKGYKEGEKAGKKAFGKAAATAVNKRAKKKFDQYVDNMKKHQANNP